MHAHFQISTIVQAHFGIVQAHFEVVRAHFRIVQTHSVIFVQAQLFPQLVFGCIGEVRTLISNWLALR